MKPISEVDDSWIDDSPREGPLTEHLRDRINKLEFVMRDADQAMRNLSNITLMLRSEINKMCHGYPRQLHQHSAQACQSVELARAELSRAHAQIFALFVEMENHSG